MFCFIKYAHNGSFNEPASFGIPELIFQARVTKFGTKVGLNMVSISSGSPKKKDFFSHFTFTVNTLTSRIIFKLSEDIYCPKISDKFDHGGSASLNMRIMDHLMSRTLLAFLNSFLPRSP